MYKRLNGRLKDAIGRWKSEYRAKTGYNRTVKVRNMAMLNRNTTTNKCASVNGRSNGANEPVKEKDEMKRKEIASEDETMRQNSNTWKRTSREGKKDI